MSIEDDTIAETAIEVRSALALVSALPLFRDLEPSVLVEIAEEIEWFSLPGGTTLFEAGEPADAVYFVVAGSLGAYNRDADGNSHFLGRIASGECVGEMALISGKERSASVVALRDSEIGRWSKRAFEALMLNHPQSLLRIAQLTIQRMQSMQSVPSRRSPALQTFAVIPHDIAVDAVSFASELVAALNTIGRAELIWNVRGSEHTSHWFHNVERANDFVVYVTDPQPSTWTKLCLRQADPILLLAQAEDSVGEWRALQSARELRLHEPRAELVLLHDEAIKAGAARRWLDLSQTIDIKRGVDGKSAIPLHHVRNKDDTARIARLLTGRGIGLTLSGGGARGFAHIGVIRALYEAKIPIDAAGGTSIGAIIAGGVAAGWNYAEMVHHIKRTFVDTNPLNDYVFPFVALTAGRKVSRLLRQEFGDVHIEDLPLPYFCVSANLTTGHSAVHRSGQLWQWLRASVAIPGVLPPVFSQGQVFVDGATINNLPVDIMRDFNRGPVIAVDVGAERVFTAHEQEGEGPPFWNVFQWFRGKRRSLNIFQILLRAGMINSTSNTAAVRAQTDLLLQPPLGQLDLLNWQAFDKVVEMGYRYAAEKLSKSDDVLLLNQHAFTPRPRADRR
ncbi:MAG TPA: patatin-like phospholipase family protein [Steroidobacteraceae bacterium]|nr:patatin-like phospholipase family protein [Steroidobacteraceae bacterium]